MLKIKDEINDINVEENGKTETIYLYGYVNTLTDKHKIDFIKELFSRGTFKGSCIANELYLINDKFGFYSNGCEYQFCEFTKRKELTEDWGGTKIETTYDYNHLKKLEFKDIYNILTDEQKEKADKLIEEKSIEFYENKYNKFYYEFEIKNNKNDIKLCTEYKDNYYEFRIKEDGYIEVILNGYEVYADNYYDIEDRIKELTDNETIKYIDKNITKLENGFVYKNNYYETFEEVKDIIEKENKDLVEKVESE